MEGDCVGCSFACKDRHVSLADGVLAYYKSESDMDLGCRGSIRVRDADVRPHEYDDARFDVFLNDVGE
jgi:collagen type IV alpha-3-binding protein